MGCANMALQLSRALQHIPGHQHWFPLQGSHSSPFMSVLMGSGRVFIFYSQSIYTSYIYPTCQWPWGADVAVLWWKAGRCWEIKEWL